MITIRVISIKISIYLRIFIAKFKCPHIVELSRILIIAMRQDNITMELIPIGCRYSSLTSGEVQRESGESDDKKLEYRKIKIKGKEYRENQMIRREYPENPVIRKDCPDQNIRREYP